MTILAKKHCIPCEGIGKPLSSEQIKEMFTQLHGGWSVVDQLKLYHPFSFENFYETMAFVNAIAWIAHQENHHPDLEIGYNYCHVSIWTHALNGLSMNDFILAKKVEDLIPLDLSHQ